MELEVAIENLKKQLENTKKASECGLATKGEFKEDIEAIETVLDYINILERAVDNKYCYVVGGRTLYSRLRELKKEDLIKAYLRLRNETNQYVKENSIPTKKIEDIILELQEAIVLENSSMYGHGDEEHIKEIEVKIVAYKELLEDK